MKVTVLSKNLEISDDLRQHIDRRIRFALSRFGDRVISASIRLADVNGPRGGQDVECLVRVDGKGWRVHILDIDANPYTVTSRACARAGRTVSRKLDRARDRSQIAPHKVLAAEQANAANDVDSEEVLMEAAALS